MVLFYYQCVNTHMPQTHCQFRGVIAACSESTASPVSVFWHLTLLIQGLNVCFELNYVFKLFLS